MSIPRKDEGTASPSLVLSELAENADGMSDAEIIDIKSIGATAIAAGAGTVGFFKLPRISSITYASADSLDAGHISTPDGAPP